MTDERLGTSSPLEIGGIYLLQTSRDRLTSDYPNYLQEFFTENAETLKKAFKIKGSLGNLAVWEVLGKIRKYFPNNSDQFEEMFGVFDYDESNNRLSFFGMKGEFDKVDVSYLIQMAPSMMVSDVNKNKRFVFLHTHPHANMQPDHKLGFPEQFSEADKDRFYELTTKYSIESSAGQRNYGSLPEMHFMVVHPRGWQIVIPSRPEFQRSNFYERQCRFDGTESRILEIDQDVYQLLQRYGLAQGVSRYISEAVALNPRLHESFMGTHRKYQNRFGKKSGSLNPYTKVATEEDKRQTWQQAESEPHKGYETHDEKYERIRKRQQQILEVLSKELLPQMNFVDEIDVGKLSVTYDMNAKNVELLPPSLKAVIKGRSPILAFGQLPSIQRLASGQDIYPISGEPRIAFRDDLSGIFFEKQNGEMKPIMINTDGVDMAVELVGAGKWGSDNPFDDGFKTLTATLTEKEANLIYSLDPRAIAKYSYNLHGEQRATVLRLAFLNPQIEALYRLQLLITHRDQLPKEFISKQLVHIQQMLRDVAKVNNPVAELKSMYLALKLVKEEVLDKERVNAIGNSAIFALA